MTDTAQPKRGGKPFQSILEPHFDFIHQQRQRRKTWQEIADLLFTEKGIRVTFYAPYRFYRSKLKRAAKSHWEDESNLAAPLSARSNAAAQSPVANDQDRKPMLAATPRPQPFRQPNLDQIQLNDPTNP